MFKPGISQKGVALYLVLATLLVVIVLANVVLSIISSQSRLTHHQISRIQAYYADMAGINYAFEMLRTGTWTIPASSASYTLTLCRSGCSINEPDLPSSVTLVNIVVSGNAVSGCHPPAGIPVCISATANYTYTP